MGNRGGNARKIAFVIDASGSLIDTFPSVVDELIKTINKLSEKQEFTIVFYQGDTVIEVPTPNLGFKRATSEIKQKVIDWIQLSSHNIVPQGTSNPIPALQRALQYHPQLIFLLSDSITGSGAYAVDQRRLLDAIKKTNTSGTKICTIQFIYTDPLANIGMKGTMQSIADQTGGKYQFVSPEDIGRNPKSLP